MTTYNTSAIYTVWRTLERLLGQAGRLGRWSTLEESPKGVCVFFGDPDAPPNTTDPTPERVVVIPAIIAPDQEWGPIGRQAREERFRVLVGVLTQVPGRTEAQVRDRLEELTAGVELVVGDIMRVAPGMRPDEFSVYPSWRMATASTLPLIAATPDGFQGRAEIEIDCEFRINTVPAT